MCEVIDKFEAKGKVDALHFIIGLPPSEIAEKTNLSVNEVQSIIDMILSEKQDNTENK
ncbi:MAG: sigma-70 family RNA polymerase sigma factor [Lachnospiraceae bacterium]|nr:sigma-70 family RNA polymerase sigma factor [Lachnospiraceae bacterium]